MRYATRKKTGGLFDGSASVALQYGPGTSRRTGILRSPIACPSLVSTAKRTFGANPTSLFRIKTDSLPASTM